MAKVSLRIYNREIERLVEQGHIDEAIAHCRHILKTFPKHLETYRMLGKAFLEAKRYSEAVDVFGRVLMSAPGDFVSHVGLSIINDEENKLDDAIWHMERAFEAQPSNAAIQGELQRLYGRRDGMEPPKIRMTRGALAHMYVQGELYPQAIAEIRAVLAEDPQRADMQLLLAYSYFKGGQKSDASDICNQLLKRYPYCFDANRIMVDLLPATAGVTESTQVYRMHIGELDPYANFVKGSVFQTAEVPDASINLERLEYVSDEVPAGQAWNSGVELGSSSFVPELGASSFDEQPDWLKSGGLKDAAPSPAGAPQTPPTTDSLSESNDQIPEFLRVAGWGESNTPEQPTSMFDDELAGEPLAPADLPDWLKGQAPVDNIDRAAEPRPDVMMQTTDTPDWLSGLDKEEPSSFDETPSSKATPSDDVPDWLSGLGGAATVAAAAVATSQPEPMPSSDTPDWLSGFGDTEKSAEPADVPDWLSGLGDTEKPAEPANVPDWLSGVNAQTEAQPADLPDWLQAAEPKSEPAPSVESLGASAQEQDDAVAWLESLAAKHGAKPEELVTDPNKRSETPPEWVQQAQTIGETQSAEKQEWSEDAQNIGEQFFAEFEDTSKAAPAIDETGMWLRDLDNKEKQEEQPLERGNIPEWLNEAQQPSDAGNKFEISEEKEVAPSSDLPNWLSGIDEDAPAESGDYVSQNLSNQDLSDWLSGLDDEPGLNIDPELIRASARPPFASPPVASAAPVEPQPVKSDLPDWLSGVEDSQAETEDDAWKESIEPAAAESILTEEPAPVALTADLPDWLKGVDEEAVEAEKADEDVPPWLHREQYEAEIPQQPKPTSPSDWHPLEPKPETAPKQAPFVEKTQTPAVQLKQPADVVPPVTQTKAQPIVKNPPSPEPSEQPRVEKKKPVKEVRPPKVEGVTNVNALVQAKGELDRGDIPTALDHYSKLIKKGKHLEETIRDLTDSIYRYPVEVGIWQTLGDAYMRANRLKEALEAYNKAEELIR